MKHSITQNTSFDKHLTKIRQAKYQATRILDITNPGHHEAETTLALAWEALFDNFCIDDKKIDLANLNTISSIVHKLTGAYTQIKSLEIKTRELDMKEHDHEAKKQQLEATLKNAKKAKEGLTKETLLQIEQQLKLL